MTTSGIFAMVGGLVLLVIIGATVRALITDGYGRRATTRSGLARLREQREDSGRDSIRERSADSATARVLDAPAVLDPEFSRAPESQERRPATRSDSSPSGAFAPTRGPAREPKRAFVGSAPSTASVSVTPRR